MIGRRFLISISFIVLLVARAAPVVGAQEQEIGVPVYDPQSKRYFALMRADKGHWLWDNVAEQARRHTFKGVRGRLAIVDSLEIHEFLLKTFHPNQYQYVWIGLRYYCRARKLEWSDGRAFRRGDFQAWDPVWKQDKWFCAGSNDPNDWGPIAYSPQGRWIAKGRHKGYEWYYIEYPTDKS